MRALSVKWLFALASAGLVAYGCGDLVSSGGDGTNAADASTSSSSDAKSPNPPPPPGAVDACVAKTCGELNASCGAVVNGCGGEIPDCGTCSTGNYCNGNTCTSQPCTKLNPQQVCTAGTCGQQPDGCGGLISCPNNCGTDKVCSGSSCNDICTSITCGAAKLAIPPNGGSCAGKADLSSGYRCSGTPSFASNLTLCGVGVIDQQRYYCGN